MSASEENLESFKARAADLLSQLTSLGFHKLSPFAHARLSKLVTAELRFLHRHPCPPLHSTNLGYLEAVVQVVQHPHVDAVSAVFHTFRRRSSSLTDVQEAVEDDRKAAEAHVDIVCTFHSKPVWIIVSDRNPKYAYWSEDCDNSKGWQSRVQLLVEVAQSLRELRPSAVLFCFARGVSSTLLTGFQRDVGASPVRVSEGPIESWRAADDSMFEGSRLVEREDGDWVCICKMEELAGLDTFFQSLRQSQTSSLKHWITFQVDIRDPSDEIHFLQCTEFNTKRPPLPEEPFMKFSDIDLKRHATSSGCKADCLQPSSHSRIEACNDGFLSCLSMLKQPVSLAGKHQDHLQTSNLVNLDTTVLIALVSEVSNGAAPTLVNMCLEELVLKFKSTAQFMRDQAEEELKRPLLAELTEIFKCWRPFMSETVCKEFKSLVLLCGSVNEKIRAEELLKVIPVVPDAPSSRVVSLRETGTIKGKNKVIFGTGDSWQAPTLTANMSFVRAVRQTGMALSVLEHKPRALVGEKCN